MNKKIYITQPVLPSKKEVNKIINDLWKSKWLTNKGTYYNSLTNKLSSFFNADYISLFANGTLALEIAYNALELKGEVITTPFTFPATIHSIMRSNLKPVFCDIKMDDYNIDENLIEKYITRHTSAICPVHVYGRPCNLKKINEIAKKYNLKVIYDSAHAFGVKINGKSITEFGDVNMLSFHATKIFHTFEGGALICKNKNLYEKFEKLKNFGITNEESVVCVGTNAKLNEFQCGIGLSILDSIGNEINKRKKNAEKYIDELKKIDCLKLPDYNNENITYNYSYFPVLVMQNKKNITRNDIYDMLKKDDILSRKYFYPLCSNYEFYKKLKNANPSKLPIANYVADNILCLPMYGDLKAEQIKLICGKIRKILV
ncbi:DegT/DnrJ/EryC1/StrS family aminotransferase [Candidatus Dependentiae bacterium]|nr:DegT/DnrJ/EryC1/StrS family aminotransferase [Candidatus Dependentiae bacterium]